MSKFYEIVIDVLKQDDRFFTAESVLLRNAVYEAAMQMDTKLIHLLLANDITKERFFKEVDGVAVFDKVGFGWIVNNREFLPDSYTRFKNKIGLVESNGNMLVSSGNVELVFPYKDCVLAGGQSREDQKRGEVFYNETLAPDEVDCLLNPKVFTNIEGNDENGEYQVDSISMQDNLIIKGNNLLTLCSLKKKYAGKIKLIYIDPPYNTGNDSFGYNDKFNHSTWLTFMCNRLKLAHELLADDGSIYVQLDWNEVHYCKVLLDEIFGAENFRNEIIWCYNGPGSPKMRQLNRKHDNILWYSKSTKNWIFNGDDVRMKSDVHVGGFNGEMTSDVSDNYTDKGKIPEDWWELFHTVEDLQSELEILQKEESNINDADWFKAAVAARIRVDGQKRTGYLTEKPYKLMERIIKQATNKGDIVLDFFAGSGTTGYVANYLQRQFIMVEQLDDTISLMRNRFKGEKYIYCELAKANQNFVEEIESASTLDEIKDVYSRIVKTGFISCKVNPKDIDDNAEDFYALSIDDQKRFLMELLDKNLLYVNYCDIDDEEFGISEEDRAFTRSFYEGA